MLVTWLLAITSIAATSKRVSRPERASDLLFANLAHRRKADPSVGLTVRPEHLLFVGGEYA